MELTDLEFGLKAVASGGNVLNIAELTGLQAGLTMLKAKDNFQSIYFWGKIYGTKTDYYIAYGLKDAGAEFLTKSFYCASADFDFMLLQQPTEQVADSVIALGLRKPLTGTPSEALDLGLPAEEETPPEIQLTEADRLAQLVHEIDFDTAVVPKGAYALNEAGMVVSSSGFQGLAASEAISLDTYAHFRPPTSVAALKALAQTDSQFYGNFLDTLDGDLPKGCWAVRQDPAAAVVSLRSLTWPGYVAFHVPGTKKFGGLYFGFGSKSRDLPFIL
jgi:radial spoke head protein 9